MSIPWGCYIISCERVSFPRVLSLMSILLGLYWGECVCSTLTTSISRIDWLVDFAKEGGCSTYVLCTSATVSSRDGSVESIVLGISLGLWGEIRFIAGHWIMKCLIITCWCCCSLLACDLLPSMGKPIMYVKQTLPQVGDSHRQEPPRNIRRIPVVDYLVIDRFVYQIEVYHLPVFENIYKTVCKTCFTYSSRFLNLIWTWQ